MDIHCYNATSGTLCDTPKRENLWDYKVVTFTSALTAIMISWFNYRTTCEKYHIACETSRKMRMAGLIHAMGQHSVIGAVVHIFKDMARLDTQVATDTLSHFRALIRADLMTLGTPAIEALAHL